MEGFGREVLAERAGVSVAFVDRLVALGLLAPSEPGAARVPGEDVRRVRFVQSLERGGLPLEGVAAAVEAGDVSLSFLESPAWQRFGGLLETTFHDIAAQTGLDLDRLRAIREAMGFARPDPDDHLREDEGEIIAWFKATIDAGADPAATERLLRVWGESARRMAEAGSEWFHAQIEVPLLQSGQTEAEVIGTGSSAATGFGRLVDPAVMSLFHAQTEHTWIASKLEAVEAALERVGVHRVTSRQPAMCFLDLAGYTRLTEEQGDAAAAEAASALSGLVRRSAHDHGGRPVKWLGDGVMVYFGEPGAAVVSALEMVRRVPEAGLPPAHAGIDTGPVIFQDGDYFGRTVNTAARIAAHAVAGQTLVSDAVRRATHEAHVTFSDIGPVSLKGVARPVDLYLATAMQAPSPPN